VRCPPGFVHLSLGARPQEFRYDSHATPNMLLQLLESRETGQVPRSAFPAGFHFDD
jgi:hypothetical protein